VFVFPFSVWVAAVDAFGAADRIRAGAAEGVFILRDECISRVIKFDSKQTNTLRFSRKHHQTTSASSSQKRFLHV
jgi:hypothetical protein